MTPTSTAAVVAADLNVTVVSKDCRSRLVMLLTGKTVKCCICWEDYAWGGVVDGSSTTNRLTEDQATCCPVGKHLYCQSCLQGHVQSKVDNLVTSIVCPQVQDCTSRAWTPREIDCFVDR